MIIYGVVGTMAALLQEIVSIYPAVNPPTLTVSQCCISRHSVHVEMNMYILFSFTCTILWDHDVKLCMLLLIVCLKYMYSTFGLKRLMLSCCINS